MEPCLYQHVIDASGYQWLKDIFLKNKIDIGAFLQDAETVLTRAHPKIRTLFLEGASNAGKTLVQELLLSGRGSVGYAELGGRERFELTPIINADFAVISEFRVTILNVDKAKRLFGGEKIPIEQKNKGTRIVYGTPVVATAQSGWAGILMGRGDRQALMNRMKIYKFFTPLSDCSVLLCPCYWQHLCLEFNPQKSLPLPGPSSAPGTMTPWEKKMDQKEDTGKLAAQTPFCAL